MELAEGLGTVTPIGLGTLALLHVILLMSGMPKKAGVVCALPSLRLASRSSLPRVTLAHQR